MTFTIADNIQRNLAFNRAERFNQGSQVFVRTSVFRRNRSFSVAGPVGLRVTLKKSASTPLGMTSALPSYL